MNDRGVSTILSYALALGILAILVSGLVVSFAPYVTNQQQASAHEALQVYGNDLAGDLETVDRLALGSEGSENATVVYRTSLPDRVSGSRYHIEVINGTDPSAETCFECKIHLEAADFDGEAFVYVRTQTEIQTTDNALDGGTLLIEYEPEKQELVIRNA